VERRIKAVWFDVDGLWVPGGGRTVNNIYQGLFSDGHEVPYGRIRDLYKKSKETRDYKRGEMDPDEWWRWFIDGLGVNTTRSRLFNLMVQDSEADPAVVEFAAELRRAKITTGILTNANPDRTEYLDRTLRFRDQVDIFLPSYDIHSLKPSPVAFYKIKTTTEEKLGSAVPEENILMGDDQAVYVNKLISLGFHGFHYPPRGAAAFKRFYHDLQSGALVRTAPGVYVAAEK
jgi:FMN phosphatase YigB (HAD superfamily)